MTQPSARLLCTNLPQEVTDDVLGVLVQQCVVTCTIDASGKFTRAAPAQISGLPVDTCRAIPHADCRWTKMQDGASHFRVARSCDGRERCARQLPTQEGLGNDGRVYLGIVAIFALSLLCCILPAEYCCPEELLVFSDSSHVGYFPNERCDYLTLRSLGSVRSSIGNLSPSHHDSPLPCSTSHSLLSSAASSRSTLRWSTLPLRCRSRTSFDMSVPSSMARRICRSSSASIDGCGCEDVRSSDIAQLGERVDQCECNGSLRGWPLEGVAYPCVHYYKTSIALRHQEPVSRQSVPLERVLVY